MTTTKPYMIAKLDNLAAQNALPSFDSLINFAVAACLDWWADGDRDQMVKDGELDPWLAACLKDEPSIANHYEMNAVCHFTAIELQQIIDDQAA